eukprot:comp23175_c1_seq1/m.37544 comp23175_c1_seq1/g.37544  ORF comp23175_c1_seq1/g.37544 comp23175_c1_seq1/m.37544 type:complete len:1228 (-) comp23175_c1_seq1:377-4060(-)
MDGSEWYQVQTVAERLGRGWATNYVAFDPFSELLWTGSQSGLVASYHGSSLEKYTSFQAHAAEVRQVMVVDGGVVSLAPDELNFTSREGLRHSSFRAGSMQDLHCMVQAQPNRATFFVAGLQESLMIADIARGRLIREIPVEQSVAVVKNSRFLCCGCTNGQVVLRDPTTLRAEHTLDAHSCTIMDMDVSGNLLATCGFSERHGQYIIDPYVKVYDLRTMRVLTLLQVLPSGPALLKFMPTMPTCLAVVSQTGEFQVLDAQNASNPGAYTYQFDMDGSICTSFDVSSTGTLMVFGDSGGLLHQWACTDDPAVNLESRELVMPDPVPSLSPININDYTVPLSPVILPHYDEHLLSDWPKRFTGPYSRPPLSIPADVKDHMKINDFVGYAPNPGSRLRNQIEYTHVPRLKRQQRQPSMERRDSNSRLPDSVPRPFRRKEIKYSKLGLEDFDFAKYNKTKFGSLEPHVPNAYCNAVLQVLYFLAPFRAHVLSHLCEKEFCLSCELGFLFHMLDLAKGENCQASNFIRAFRTMPQASALGLLLTGEEKKANVPQLIQNFNRFLLQQVQQETAAGTADQSVVADMFRSQQCISSRCAVCNEEGTRETDGLMFDMSYPAEYLPLPFASLLRDSMLKEQQTKAWCAKCQRYQITVQKKRIKTLPKMLSISCSAEKDSDLRFWHSPDGGVYNEEFESWLPTTLEVTLTDTNDVIITSTLYSSVEKGGLDDGAASSTSELCDPSVDQSDAGDSMSATTENTENGESEDPLPTSSNGMPESTPSANHDLSVPMPGPFAPPSPAVIPVTNMNYAKAVGKLLGKSQESPSPPYSGNLHTATPPPGGNNQTKETEGTEAGKEQEGVNVNSTNAGEGTLVPPGQESKNGVKDEGKSGVVQRIQYELVAVVAHINHEAYGGNLVAQIKVDPPYLKRVGMEGVGSQWYLFNDYSVSTLSAREAFHFNTTWKVPCLLYYAQVGLSEGIQDPPSRELVSADILMDDSKYVAKNRRRPSVPRSIVPVTLDRLPCKGYHVAIDAEFVALHKEEASIRSDGTKNTIKPSQLSLARVSVIHGEQPHFGEPFIDDYICTSEQIVDYLTQFSGIHPGDLDASVSTKHLMTLKATYLKLRSLADRGVIFIGHGLKKDFRIINIHIPPEQVIDTVELFYLKWQRKISLRFLAWYLLNMDVQAGNHDSIEDSRTALYLYEHYKQLVAEGTLDKTLREIYEAGRKYKWKAPHWES